MFPFPFSFVAPTASGLADIDNVYSMEFDGVDDYFQAAAASDVIADFKQPWSVSWWAKWGTQASTSFNGFWQLGNIAGGNTVQLCAQIDATGSGGQITFAHGYVMFPTIQRGFGSGLNDNQWHHYCATGDGSAGNFIVYIDGSSVVQSGGSTASSFATDSNNNIGRMKFGSSVRAFGGFIDELAIFDYQLDSGQVDEIYNATSSGKTADLSSMATPPVAWYRMGD